ncbi:hypothetical protein BMS3Bbin11_01854 [bacterium BMS3Bbin11]|nr:hypothetical protein BMS3Abin11_00517 [bacterium BMS3Abin11]GBE46753.1 hypothetical protein BMS3Bbin11_01854 [bacterium BMS3Bbin11]GMT41098.1 MAG: hypothetical protein IEMM0001_1833 [bacterium]
MQTEVHNSLLDISPDEWDTLNHDNNPSISYAFLSTLEESASTGGRKAHVTHYQQILNKYSPFRNDTKND